MYSVSGSIGCPWALSGFETLNAAKVVAIVSQTISKASQRPGHALHRAFLSGSKGCNLLDLPSAKAECG